MIIIVNDPSPRSKRDANDALIETGAEQEVPGLTTMTSNHDCRMEIILLQIIIIFFFHHRNILLLKNY